MKFDYDQIFKFSIRALRINQCHPSVKRDTRWFISFLFFHSLFSLVFCLVMYNIIYVNLKNNDFDETCKNGVLAVIFVVVTFQFTIMLWKQDLIMSLMLFVKQDYAEANNQTKDDQEIMLKYAKNGAHVCKQWWLISCAAPGTFIVKNIILLSYYYFKGEPKFIPLYDLTYPSIIDEYKENIYVYLGIYAMLLFYSGYSMCTYTGFVPLGPTFMLHACGQLEILEKKIHGLYRDGGDVENKLNYIITRLQSLYDFVEEIKMTFRVAYELTLKATTIILPITCYEVIESVNRGELPLEFITFIVGGVLISSSPCYYSDLLMEKGEGIRLAIYSCGWEMEYNPKVRSTIRLLLLRALKPMAIRTLFRTVCLDALTDLFQQSYTIFNLMNAMWE